MARRRAWRSAGTGDRRATEAGSRGTPNRKRNTMATHPHTGEKAPQSGIYKPTNGGKEIAVSKGDTLPPSKGQGTGYKLVRPTK